ncbi:MAG: lysyl oxidase family protein, partial [Bradymonadaceae bacterium]
VDPANNVFVASAEVKLFKWPPPSEIGSDNPSWSWPSSPLTADHVVTTASTSYSGYNWAINQWSHSCISGVADGVVENNRWHRIRVSKAGYDTSFHYRYHGSHSESCDIWDCETESWISGTCFSYDDFDLYPDSVVYDRLPDIFLDPRDLEDNQFECVQLPDAEVPNDPKIKRVGLRVSVGTANVGAGNFHLKGYNFDDGNPSTNYVNQVITRSNGTTHELLVDDAAFEHHAGHGHIHVKDWAQLRIVSNLSSCNVHPNGRSPSCVLEEGEKRSFCAMDLEEFDEEIIDEYGTPQFFADCGDAEKQGITSGWKDRYHKGLEGQVIILGAPPSAMVSPGTYMLEAHFDPTNVFSNELNKDNNAVRISVTIPSFTTSDDPEFNANCPTPILDCRSFPSISSPTIHARCRDYLKCSSTADCTESLTCQSLAGFTDMFCQL